MPTLEDIKIGALPGDNPEEQIEGIVRQLNEWGRRISNEEITKIIKSDQTTEAMKIGALGDNKFGISFSDGDVTLLTITKDGLAMYDENHQRFLLGRGDFS